MLRCRIDRLGGRGRGSVELDGFVAALEATRLDEVPAVVAAAEEAAGRGLHVAGFVAYDAAPAFDAAYAVPRGQPAIPLAWFGCFEEEVAADALEPTGLDAEPAWSIDLDRADHGQGVAAIQSAIEEGDAYLVNFTARLRRPWRPNEDALALYRRLLASYASGYHTLIETDRWAIACGSPELFFERQGGLVTTRPMKGTAARGRWSGEDEAAAVALASSAKERAENVMVVDLLRNDLGRVAKPGSVVVPSLAKAERHPALWQLTSTVRAEVSGELGLAELFAALFPCASVTGAPKIASMGIIAKLEERPRGLYCGAVGHLSPGVNGVHARFAVAIRSAVVDKVAGEVVYGSGGGITADSDAEAEWRELLLKAEALARPTAPLAAQGLGLIETMGFAPATGIANLERHLDRLAASARYLGLELPHDLRSRLNAEVEGLGVASRLRLELRTGGLEVEVHPLEPPSGAPVTLAVDGEPVDPRDPGLYHKTTDRSRYERRQARHPEVDDVVLVNDRGEVTETARANLAVLLNGRWCTPPLSAGLLPGVERARRIAEGQLVERVVTLAELLAAEQVATLSSLRGWREAKVVSFPGGR